MIKEIKVNKVAKIQLQACLSHFSIQTKYEHSKPIFLFLGNFKILVNVPGSQCGANWMFSS